jgi:hypothetical protein
VCMRLPRFASLCNLIMLTFVTSALHAQDLPPQPKSGAKLCVATVGNASTTQAFVERLTERLTRSLKQNKINAVSMDSRTTDKRPLELSTDNGEEAKQKECDYVLLSQIRDPRQRPFEPQPPQISIGGRVPSVEASDPLGGSSGPVYRENLQVFFALFRIGRFKPVLDTYVLDRPSANVSDTLLPAMDHEANRVGHELKKR